MTIRKQWFFCERFEPTLEQFHYSKVSDSRTTLMHLPAVQGVLEKSAGEGERKKIEHLRCSSKY